MNRSSVSTAEISKVEPGPITAPFPCFTLPNPEGRWFTWRDTDWKTGPAMFFETLDAIAFLVYLPDG